MIVERVSFSRKVLDELHRLDFIGGTEKEDADHLVVGILLTCNSEFLGPDETGYCEVPISPSSPDNRDPFLVLRVQCQGGTAEVFDIEDRSHSY